MKKQEAIERARGIEEGARYLSDPRQGVHALAQLVRELCENPPTEEPEAAPEVAPEAAQADPEPTGEA